MSIENLQEELRGSMSRHEKMARGINLLNEERERARSRLAHLERELPRLCAGEFLGEVQTEEVLSVKKEIAKIKEALADVPLIIGGLQVMQEEIAVRHTRTLNKLHRLQATELLEKHLGELETEGWSRDLATDIRLAASDCGRSKQEIEKILNEAQALAENKPVGE